MNNSTVKKKCGWIKGLTKETDKKVAKMAKTKAFNLNCIQSSLKNGFGANCYYNNEFFPSLQEKDCYIKLRKLGFKVKHNFENRFDFLINDKIVLEYHPFDIKRLTDNLYYIQRRKILDEYGYKDLKLIVIKDLKEIENKLILEGGLNDVSV